MVAAGRDGALIPNHSLGGHKTEDITSPTISQQRRHCPKRGTRRRHIINDQH
jgi:hypothetical protein